VSEHDHDVTDCVRSNLYFRCIIRYGKEAAEVAKDGFGVAIDTVETVYNVKQLGIKKMAKRVAVETGKQTAKRLGSDENEDAEELLMLTDKPPTLALEAGSAKQPALS